MTLSPVTTRPTTNRAAPSEARRILWSSSAQTRAVPAVPNRVVQAATQNRVQLNQAVENRVEQNAVKNRVEQHAVDNRVEPNHAVANRVDFAA